jgi:tRNA(His) 5'-end guanylyltransferase
MKKFGVADDNEVSDLMSFAETIASEITDTEAGIDLFVTLSFEAFIVISPSSLRRKRIEFVESVFCSCADPVVVKKFRARKRITESRIFIF